MRYKLIEGVSFAAIDDTEGVAMHPRTLATFAFNETGVWLYRKAQQADGVADVNDLSKALSQDFDVSYQRALEDVGLFWQILEDRGLAKRLLEKET